MKPNRRLPLLAGGSISLFIIIGLLGAGGSAFAREAVHHPPHHHTKKNPPPHTTVVPDVPPPACFPTPGSNPTSVSVKCVNFDGFASPFTLTVTPDCAALTVTDSTGTVIQRNGGSWVLPFPPTGNLSFSLDGSGCPHGIYQVSVDGPGGGHFSSFTASW